MPLSTHDSLKKKKLTCREGKLTGHIHKKPEFREFSTPAIGLFYKNRQLRRRLHLERNCEDSHVKKCTLRLVLLT